MTRIEDLAAALARPKHEETATSQAKSEESAAKPHDRGDGASQTESLNLCPLPEEWMNASDGGGLKSASENAYRVIALLIEHGWSDAAIKQLVMRYPHGVGKRYLGNKKLDADIKRIRRKLSARPGADAKRQHGDPGFSPGADNKGTSDSSQGPKAEGPSAPEGDWPEPAPLHATLPAPPFPVDALPRVIADYTTDAAERMQCSVDLIAIPALFTCASLIGKEAVLRPKAEDDEWEERPCLWGMSIAPPGSMKSPALKVAIQPLVKVEAKLAQTYREEKARWDAQQAAADSRSKASEKKRKGTPG